MILRQYLHTTPVIAASYLVRAASRLFPTTSRFCLAPLQAQCVAAR